ncbi:hypothetical protein OUZ56_012984 [Daphnia magna]|uniref:Uncharacterized protein n=1 Tax=Daphnia magna TaxID=35525 RepID=A0ABQ9Z4L6_9CRUS|nr:hypothetical protein OUZ56_012984 [Daphnia magna]
MPRRSGLNRNKSVKLKQQNTIAEFTIMFNAGGEFGRSCIGVKNKIVRFVQPSRVFVPLSNKEKSVPTSPKKSEFA